MKLLSSVVLLSVLAVNALSAEKDNCNSPDIVQGVELVREVIPYKVDEVTTLIGITCYDNIMYYTYDLKDFNDRKVSTLNDVETTFVKAIMEKNLRKDYCEKLTEFHDVLKAVKWSYLHKGKTLFDVTHNKESCK